MSTIFQWSEDELSLHPFCNHNPSSTVVPLLALFVNVKVQRVSQNACREMNGTISESPTRVSQTLSLRISLHDAVTAAVLWN